MSVFEVERSSSLLLAVGIASAGRPEILARIVAELKNQDRRPDAIVLSVPSESDVGNLAAEFPDVQVIVGARGLTFQRNAILRRLDGYDAVVFFDDDFVPCADYLAQVEKILVDRPDVVMTTGRVIKDGIIGPGLSFEAAKELIAAAGPAPEPASLTPVYNGYGCNMSVRLDPVRQHGLAFDEVLGCYAWLEDVDFSRQLAAHGLIYRASDTRGVHLGIKFGRQSGLRFGYSQVANPLYLVRKGTCTWRKALHQMSRNVAINVAKCLWPEPYIDRKGRLRGNLVAVFDLVRGRLMPSRTVTFGS